MLRAMRILKARQRSVTTMNRNTASPKSLRSRGLTEEVADRSFVVGASGAEASPADAEDHYCADSVEAEDILLESAQPWTAARTVAQIAVLQEEVSEEEPRSLSEYRETRADSAISQVTGRTIVLTG